MRTIKVQEMADRAFAKFAPQLDRVYHNIRAVEYLEARIITLEAKAV